MKALLFMSFTVLVSTVSYSQSGKREVHQKISYKNFDMSRLHEGTESTATIPYNLPMKALRRFYPKHPDADQIKWFTIKGGYEVCFREEKKDNRMVFDSRGYYLYQMISYPVDLLDPEILAQVKGAYGEEYTIHWINELHAQSKICYMIRLEGRTKWLQIKILDDRMYLMEEIFKL